MQTGYLFFFRSLSEYLSMPKSKRETRMATIITKITLEIPSPVRTDSLFTSQIPITSAIKSKTIHTLESLTVISAFSAATGTKKKTIVTRKAEKTEASPLERTALPKTTDELKICDKTASKMLFTTQIAKNLISLVCSIQPHIQRINQAESQVNTKLT